MFLKTPKASTDQRVRSLLQKAARRGYAETAELAVARLDTNGDKAWLRSRTVVITFEECWPLAASLEINSEISSKRRALVKVAKAVKQKDAAGLGALAHAYGEGNQSMLDLVPNRHILKIVSEALKRPRDFFKWVRDETKEQSSIEVIWAAEKYLPVATWPWDKACILAGALLASVGIVPIVESIEMPSEEFHYWVALDKHTPEGKVVLAEIAKQLKSSYRQLIWASFYCESASVNRLLPSPWWDAEKRWRLRHAGLSWDGAQELWSRARPLISQRLESEAASLQSNVESIVSSVTPTQMNFLK